MFYMHRSMKTDAKYGNEKEIRNYKRRAGCSAVFRVCISCTTKRIHPNDKQYESRVCRDCNPLGESPPSAGAGIARQRAGQTADQPGQSEDLNAA